MIVEKMINIRKWLENKSDDELLEFWLNKIIYNIGCDACPVDRHECNKIKNKECEEVFLEWSKSEWVQNTNK